MSGSGEFGVLTNGRCAMAGVETGGAVRLGNAYDRLDSAARCVRCILRERTRSYVERGKEFSNQPARQPLGRVILIVDLLGKEFLVRPLCGLVSKNHVSCYAVALFRGFRLPSPERCKNHRENVALALLAEREFATRAPHTTKMPHFSGETATFWATGSKNRNGIASPVVLPFRRPEGGLRKYPRLADWAAASNAWPQLNVRFSLGS